MIVSSDFVHFMTFLNMSTENTNIDTKTQILKIKQQTLNLIESLTLQPKPSYKIEGQSVSWNEYMKQLQETVRWCDSILNATEISWIHSRGVSP